MTRSDQVIGYRARHRLPAESVSRGGADGNLETVERIYEALRRGDVTALIDTIAEDVDWAAEAFSAGSPGYGIRHGKDDVAADLRASASAVEVLEFTPLSWAATDDDVLSMVRCRIRFTGTGKTLAMNLHQLFTFAGGQIVCYRSAHTALTEETLGC